MLSFFRTWNEDAMWLQLLYHDDVIKWKHFSRYWPFVRGIRRSLVNSPHKGQLRGALMFYFICAWTNGWVNIRNAGDLRNNRAYCDVSEMWWKMTNQSIALIIELWKTIINRTWKGKNPTIIAYLLINISDYVFWNWGENLWFITLGRYCCYIL